MDMSGARGSLTPMGAARADGGAGPDPRGERGRKVAWPSGPAGRALYRGRAPPRRWRPAAPR
eukprot:3137911-Pyramimonas_sp.AAC.1